MDNRPKIGLALGSGAARGFAHIGVIKALKENNIHVDYVAGSSIGAVIGALHCSDAPLEDIAKVLGYIKPKFLIDFTTSRNGLVIGNKIEELLKFFIKVKTFEELNIPLAVVATNLKTGGREVFTNGDLIKPLRASISIPGIFAPVHYEGKLLVDGALIDRVPSSVAKKMGSDIVIGVDIGFRPGEHFSPKSIFEILIQSIGIMELQILKRRIEKCDVLITPQVDHIRPFSLDKIEDCIEQGAAAARLKMGEIHSLVKSKRLIL